jgi:chromosome segregation ATPase
MAGLGLQDDAQSADGQLQLGLQLIQQSYNRRVEELTREVEHWKRVAQHHKQQEAQTREELGKSNQRGAELQRQLGEKNTEVQQLTEARNVALNQIATLKKHASQLQSFKKNISNMLQVRVRPRRPHHPLAAAAALVSPRENPWALSCPLPHLPAWS